MCAGGRFSHGVAGEKPGLSQRLRGTPSVPTASSAGPITPSPPNPPPPAHLSIPPSLPPLSLSNTSCQPSRAYYPGMQFPSSLLSSSDLLLIYCTKPLQQSNHNEDQGQESDAVFLPGPAQLQPGLQ